MVTRKRLVWIGLAAACAFGVGAEVAAGAPLGRALAAADLAVGLVLLAFGAAALIGRPGSRIGIWLGAAGIAWFLGTVGWPFVTLHRGVFVLAFLAYPIGLLPRSWLARAAAVAAFVVWALPPLARDDHLTIAVAGVVAVAAFRLFLDGRSAPRRIAVVALLSAVAFVGVLSTAAALRLDGVAPERPMLWGYDVAVAAAAALLLLLGLLRERRSDGVLRSLVVDLGRLGDSASLRGRIARALGDPSLVIGIWDDERRAYMEESGAPVRMPEEGSGRVATRIDDDGGPLALLVDDEAALPEPALLAPVASVARTAVANDTLELRIRGQAREIAASRRRLVEAADGEQRVLKQTLARGPERRLRRVSQLLEEAAKSGAVADGVELQRAVEAAIGELGELANGVRPAELEGGLGEALPALAERSPIDIAVQVEAGRLPESVEAAAYFVCSEALANAAKHAHAASAQIQAAVRSGRLHVTVSDDGVGGAKAEGSGLRGLADRVEALSGRLRVESSPGTGTRVHAEIPCS